MDDAIALARLIVVWLMFVMLVVSAWLWHLAKQSAERYVSSATQSAAAAFPHDPEPGRSCGHRIDTTTLAAAAHAADVAVAELSSPRMGAVVTESPLGRSGLVGLWNEGCKVYVAVTVKPLGAKFKLTDARSVRCVDFAGERPQACSAI